MSQTININSVSLEDFVSNCINEEIGESGAIEAEIDAIEAEIERLLKEEADTGESIIGGNLLGRVNECIKVLEQVKQYMPIKREAKRLQSMSEKAYNKSRLKNKEEAHENFEEAKINAAKRLASAKEELYNAYDKNKIKAAIREGYIIVTLLREKLTGQIIDYKIVATGEQSDGDPILFESHPTLQQVLLYSNLDTSNFSLRLDMAKSQFEILMQTNDQSDSEDNMSKLKNTILEDMQQVILSSDEHNMLKKFVAVKRSLARVKGAKMNYGQIIEGYEEYLLNSSSMALDDAAGIYDLLVKGRNNLAYYLGGDIEVRETIEEENFFRYYQLKVLSSFEEQKYGGRADIANYSNVLNPLYSIKDFLEKMQKGEDVKEAFVKYFIAADGQGDRPFKEKLEKRIKRIIRDPFKTSKKT